MSAGHRSICAGYRKYESHTSEQSAVPDINDALVFLLVDRLSRHFRKMAALAATSGYDVR